MEHHVAQRECIRHSKVYRKDTRTAGPDQWDYEVNKRSITYLCGERNLAVVKRYSVWRWRMYERKARLKSQVAGKADCNRHGIRVNISAIVAKDLVSLLAAPANRVASQYLNRQRRTVSSFYGKSRRQ